MKFGYILLFFSVLWFANGFSQDSTSTIISAIQKDHLFREKVFLHLNKSVYTKNETLWYKAYVVEDATNIPSDYTSNLYVNIVDLNGNIMDHATILIQNGIGTGDFLIDAKYVSDAYYIQAYTNYMQNFGSENSFVEPFQILQQKEGTSPKIPDPEPNYDLQVFPESGLLLENAENTLGIKFLQNGKGVKYSGVLKNSNNEVVVSFKGNKFGMSKCSFWYDEDERYFVSITKGMIEKTIEVPKAQKTGIVFTVDPADATQLHLNINTNKASIPTLVNDELLVLVYRNNYITKAFEVKIKDNGNTTQTMPVQTSELLNGVNIITLFRNDKPIAERKIFIDKPEEDSALLISSLEEKIDTTSFRLKSIDAQFNPVAANLSVSVLTPKSKIYRQNQSIKSAFLLTPYVNGFIEDPSYYFDKNREHRKEFLDLLLLCQGWTAYTLSEKLELLNPEEKFEFETGISIQGVVKKVPKGYDIALLSKTNKIVSISEFNTKKEFRFDHIFAFKKDTAKVTFIKKNELPKKPTEIDLLGSETPSRSFKAHLNPNSESIHATYEAGDTIAYTINDLTGEALNEVVLKNVKKPVHKIASIYDYEDQIAEKHREIAASFYQSKKVTPDMELTYRNVLDYLQHLGLVKITGYGQSFISMRNTRGIISGANPDGTYPPTVFLDGVKISSVSDSSSSDIQREDASIDFLRNLKMYEVDEIMINRSGAGQGILGMGGVIKIFLKKGDHSYFQQETDDERYASLLLKTGFQRSKKYYAPLYNSINELTYPWMEIDWKNIIQTDSNGEAVLKIPTNNYSNEFMFVIYGIASDGTLFQTMYNPSQSLFD